MRRSTQSFRDLSPDPDVLIAAEGGIREADMEFVNAAVSEARVSTGRSKLVAAQTRVPTSSSLPPAKRLRQPEQRGGD